QSRNAYFEQGRTGIENVSQALERSLQVQDGIVDKTLETDISMLEADLSLAGKPMLNKNRTKDLVLKDSSGEQLEEVTIPRLMFGLEYVTLDHSIVDEVAQKSNGYAAVFQVVEDKLVCVSSSEQEGDSRPVGRFLDQDDPAHQAVMQGESYAGLDTLQEEPSKVLLKPIRDASQGEVIGALFVARGLITPDLVQLVESTRVDGQGFALTLSGDGELLVEPAGVSISGDSQLVQELAGAEAGLQDIELGQEDYHAYIQDFEPWDMRFVVALSQAEMMSGVNKAIFSTAGASGAIALAVAVVIIWFLLRQIMRPLYGLAGMAKEVAQGNFNTTFEYNARDAVGDTVSAVSDMVGELKNRLGFSQGLLNSLPIPCVVADHKEQIFFVNQPAVDYLEFDKRPEDLHGMTVGEFFYNDRNHSTVISQAIDSKKPVLNVQTEGTTRKNNKIYLRVDAAPLYDLDGNFIAAYVLYSDMTENKKQEMQIKEQNQMVLDAAQNANTISEQVSTAADQLSAQVEQASRGAEQQKGRISEIVSSVEEMSNTVLEVSKNASNASQSGEETKKIAQEGADVVQEVVDSISHIQDQARELQANINNLGQKAEGVGKVMNVIEDIADQTNLLALNAAIEAARAGEAGKGFAVVADEVRKLAEKTMQATKEVGQAVEEIQSGTRQNIANTEKTVELIQESTQKVNQAGEALQKIVDMVEDSANQISSIATAVEEQSTTTEEINQAMEDVNRIAKETSESMVQSAQAVNELASQAQKLKDVMQSLQASAREE
ncbi:MAG: methyl-accepting chemotaxis protein, partial [Thermodesulfobacteriota bacterium]